MKNYEVLISDFKIDDKFVPLYFSNTKLKDILVTVNEKYIGKYLPFNVDNNNNIVNIDINTKQGIINFIDRVNNHLKFLPKKVSDKLLFDFTYKFY